MTTPDIITPVSGSSPRTDANGSWATGVYQYNSTVGTKEIYSLSFPQSNGSYSNMGLNSAIYVETTTNTWYDYTTTSIPQTVTDSGTQILLYDASGALMITLPKPSTASWIGTSTQGSSVPSGSEYINAQGQLVFVINSGSPSSDGNIVYKIFRRLKGGTLQQAYVVPHTSGAPTSFNIGLNLSLYDKWELRVESNTALVQSAVLAVHTNIKKVFCNFW